MGDERFEYTRREPIRADYKSYYWWGGFWCATFWWAVLILCSLADGWRWLGTILFGEGRGY